MEASPSMTIATREPPPSEPFLLRCKTTLDTVAAPIAAGYIAGSCGVFVGHPLDSLKVLLQTNATGTPPPGATTTASAPINTTTRNYFSLSTTPSSNSIVAQSGSLPNRSLRSLYSGVAVPLLSVGLIQSLVFAVYDASRRVLYRYNNGNNNGMEDCSYLYHDSLTNVGISAAVAGAVTSIFTSPLMVVKTKQQIMMWSMRKAARDTFLHQGGIRNFFCGFGPHFICESFGRAIYFSSYEFFKRKIAQRNESNSNGNLNLSISQHTPDPSHQISLPQRMLCAGVSGMICWSAIFPFDAVRSKTYAQAALIPNSSNAPCPLQISKAMWEKGGVSPFFRGFGVTVFRAGPVAMIVLPVYDVTLEWLTRKGDC